MVLFRNNDIVNFMNTLHNTSISIIMIYLFYFEYVIWRINAHEKQERKR